MRDSLTETTNELMIERNKIKLLSEATAGSNDYSNDLKGLTDNTILSMDNTQKGDFINNNYNINSNDYEDFEIKNLKSEVITLKNQINNISFNKSTEDMETVQNDLNLVKQWKHNVEKERKKVSKI